MCIACQQEFMWLAYLESRGLAGPENAAAAPTPLAALAEEPPSPPTAQNEREAADESGFAGDDPTAE